MLNVRIPRDMEARLNVLAESTNRPKSFYVREALERSIDDMEKTYLAEAEGDDPFYSVQNQAHLEKVFADLDSGTNCTNHDLSAD